MNCSIESLIDHIFEKVQDRKEPTLKEFVMSLNGRSFKRKVGKGWSSVEIIKKRVIQC
jgi:hypothetical protein